MGGVHTVNTCSRCGRRFDAGSPESCCYHCDIIVRAEAELRRGGLTPEQITNRERKIQEIKESLKQWIR